MSLPEPYLRAQKSLWWYLNQYDKSKSFYLREYYLIRADFYAKKLAKLRDFHNDCE